MSAGSAEPFAEPFGYLIDVDEVGVHLLSPQAVEAVVRWARKARLYDRANGAGVWSADVLAFASVIEAALTSGRCVRSASPLRADESGLTLWPTPLLLDRLGLAKSQGLLLLRRAGIKPVEPARGRRPALWLAADVQPIVAQRRSAA